MILVDSSAWIDHFNQHSSVQAIHLAHLIEYDWPLTFPGVVLTEVLAGVKAEPDAERVADLMTAFDLAPEFDESDYREAARIRRVCRSRGITLTSTIDCLIAQLCLRRNYEILTKDGDFDAIAQHFPLRRVDMRLAVHDRPR